ncbi:MAG: ParB/RepB/Spo0J family partition protein [Bacteroidales bacterium]|nr:ParB/RepB/Spo0J family partition protein [Bacteroidales bacterium]
MSAKNRGLGKGLGALMGSVPAADALRKPVGYINKEIAGSRPASEADILRIPVDMVEANPFQPRMTFDRESLEELAASIRSLGLIQPVTVRRLGSGMYQIISGERRYRACRMAGMTMIPAYVRDTNDQGMLEMAIVENIQREDLDPVEVAMSFQRLIDECSLTQEQMAERVGKKRATVANTLRLLKLPVKVQHDLKVGLISSGHAKALLALDDAELQEKLCDLVITRGLSVRELEDMVRKSKAGEMPDIPSKQEPLPLPDDYNRLLSSMGRYFSRDITVRRTASGKGSMTIRFNSDEEVARFLEALDKAEI